ncbi:uncharacterized protein BDR25DRAFT_128421 [Lindgomyces ingoldianus]|uniref:Uncharacterized protein n=1 Tax=Lindgomyces ingoldianus TaxID=673940 RepID=A0ACB6R215_9PLEO|nr:uncharacterized protein BDR25DRAFT_128421 [Lindgomyces ingoldianus]KAF2473087.1 hypothetical protein BDR25DRAFT_128421 [Lindgomyces ingoldianus]
MSSEQTFSTHDLRSGAKEFGRDKDQRVKWAHGTSYGPGRRVEDARPRPARVIPTPKSTAGFNKARTALKNDMVDASDSSADEEVDEPSAAPAPDAEITYSYDAERGPSHGSQVLGQALAQAIERFEVHQTDKLIKEEYEVLDAGEVLSPAPRPRRHGVTPEDEDYEFIEA